VPVNCGARQASLAHFGGALYDSGLYIVIQKMRPAPIFSFPKLISPVILPGASVSSLYRPLPDYLSDGNIINEFYCMLLRRRVAHPRPQPHSPTEPVVAMTGSRGPLATCHPHPKLEGGLSPRAASQGQLDGRRWLGAPRLEFFFPFFFWCRYLLPGSGGTRSIYLGHTTDEQGN
jgi:hypothetical protein